jgi:hypothetical protein
MSVLLGSGATAPGSGAACRAACARVCMPWVCVHRHTRSTWRYAAEAPACAKPRRHGGVRGQHGHGATTAAVTEWQRWRSRWEAWHGSVLGLCMCACVRCPGLPGSWLVTNKAAWQWVKAKARAWLLDRVCTHARESWHSRTMVWPCHAQGTDVPGPWHDAAAEGQ